VAATPWTGAPATLKQYDQVTMPQTPNGSLVFEYLNVSTQSNAGLLNLTSAGSPVTSLQAPALIYRPGILTNNWQANNLTVTNLSANSNTPIYIAAIGPGLPGLVPMNLVANAPAITLPIFAAAQGILKANSNILQMQANASSITVFVIVGGPLDSTGNNASVIAVNDNIDGNTGPGTGIEPPAGYYATTTSNSYSFPANWPGATIFVANLSPATNVQATVRLISL
jgi:hypothetical protein